MLNSSQTADYMEERYDVYMLIKEEEQAHRLI